MNVLRDGRCARDIIAPMSVEDYKAGASAARNKLAGFLRDRGLKMAFGSTPPEDDDFWYAIQEFAERYGATLPQFGEESAASRNFRESLESYRKKQQMKATASTTSLSETNSQELKCRHCGEPFVPKRGKPGYVDECPACVHTRSYPGPVQPVGVSHNITDEKLDATIQTFLQTYKPRAPKVSAALARVLESLARKLKTRDYPFNEGR